MDGVLEILHSICTSLAFVSLAFEPESILFALDDFYHVERCSIKELDLAIMASFPIRCSDNCNVLCHTILFTSLMICLNIRFPLFPFGKRLFTQVLPSSFYHIERNILGMFDIILLFIFIFSFPVFRIRK